MHSDKNSDRIGQERKYDAERALEDALRSESKYDYGPTTDFNHLQTSLAALAEHKQAEKRTPMDRMYNQIQHMTRRSRLTVTAAVAVAALALFTLVPFTYQDTIGYEVAFAGVDKEVAMDKVKLHEILEQLGVGGAVVDVYGCEETCNLRITELKSAHDAQLVRTAFGSSKNVRLIFEGDEYSDGVKALIELKSGNLLDKAHSMFFALGDDDHDVSSFGELHKIVMEKLGNEFDPDQTVWIKAVKTGDGEMKVSIDVPEGQEGGFFSKDGQLQGIFTFGGDEGSDKIFKHKLVDGYDADGKKFERLTVDLSSVGFAEGGLSDEEIARLQEKGYEVTVTENEDGSRMISLSKKTEDQNTSAFGDDLFADPLDKTTPSALPEGYALSQNYPNPFNPTTKIDYSVGSAEHVTIEILNVMGQVVRTLVDESVGAGQYTVEWDSRSDSGVRVSSGMYFYRFRAGDVVETKKMALLK